MSMIIMYHSEGKTTLPKCKICGESAKYSYYGAIVCQSCKMFFKRNAESRQGLLKCSFRQDCQINQNNRHICSSCRLAKCFQNGMRVEMIRSSRQRKNKERKKTPLLPDLKASTSTELSIPYNQTSPQKISTFNFIQHSQQTLNTDQWNLLSSLVHCFDEYGGYSLTEHFLQNQNALPIKLRYKFSVVKQFLTLIRTKIELVFASQQHFRSLTFDDRQLLLRTTVEHTTTLGILFTIRQHHLFDYPSFYHSTEIVIGPNAAALAKRIVGQLDPDDTLIKLIIAVLFFSTTNYPVYTNYNASSMTNIRAILAIQNLYIELAWQYAVYKYGSDEAVVRLLNLIQCLLVVNQAIVEAHESQQFLEIIHIVVKEVDQSVCF